MKHTNYVRHRRDPRPAALMPGSLVHVGEKRMPHVRIQVIDFDADAVHEKEVASSAECLAFEKGDSPTWIRVMGLHEVGKIGELLQAYDIHALVQDDVLNTNQPAKVEDFEDYLFVTLPMLSQAAEAASGAASSPLQKFSAILTKRIVITFEEAPSEHFEPVLNRLREGKGRLRKSGPDYLLWALLDAILDQYLKVIDETSERVALLDTRLMDTRQSVTVPEIHSLRSEMHSLYQLVRPMREICVALQHSESVLLSESLTPFLRDLYDHAWHAIETTERLREEVTAMRDYHGAMQNQRMNEIMKVLAAISTIFLPLTFIAGVYGMNFEHQPEFKWRLGYPAVWCLFLLTAFALLYYFRRRKWL